MNIITKVVGNRAVPYVLTALTVVAGGATAKSLTNDYSEATKNITITEKPKTFDIQDLPISNESKTYATLFALGLLGTGAIVRKNKQDKNYEQELQNTIGKNSFHIEFLGPDSFKLADINGSAIGDFKYSMEGLSQKQIKELVIYTLSKDFKPKSLSSDILENPRIKILQQKISTDVKYSRESIENRLMEEFGLNTYDASSDSLELFMLMRNKPVEIREEYFNIYKTKGRRALFWDGISYISCDKLKIELLKNHGIEITDMEIIKNQDKTSDTEEVEDFDDETLEKEEKTAKTLIKISVKQNGKTTSYLIPDYTDTLFLSDLVDKMVEDEFGKEQ